MTRPRPAPRFSRSPSRLSGPPSTDPAQALAAFGISATEAEELASTGIVGR
jgi:hypothetical protein